MHVGPHCPTTCHPTGDLLNINHSPAGNTGYGHYEAARLTSKADVLKEYKNRQLFMKDYARQAGARPFIPQAEGL